MDPPRPDDTARRRLVLALLAVVPFCNVFTLPFVNWDDGDLVVDNARVHALSSLPSLWSPAAALSGGAHEFLPLRDTLYALLWSVDGGNPWPFHSANVVLHLLVTLEVLAMGRLLLPGGRGAFVAAALFAVHPLHSEPVSWVSGMKDPLFTLFTLRALRFHVVETRPVSPGGVLMTAAALASKSIAVVIPALLFTVDVLLLRRPRAVARALPHAVLVLPALWLSVRVGQASGVILDGAAHDRVRSLLTFCTLLPRYAGTWFLPLELNVRHAVVPVHAFTEGRVLASLVLVVAVAVAAGRAGNRGHAAALLAFLLPLLPVSNVVPISTEWADRYAYLPSVAAALWTGAALARAPERVAGRVLLGVSLCVLASVTVLRNEAWRGDVALWSDFADQPDAAAWPDGWMNLAAARAHAGDLDGAMEAWQSAADADGTTRRLTHPHAPWLHMAETSVRAGKAAEARQDAAQCTRRAPGDADCARVAAWAAAALGDREGARAESARMVALDPGRCAEVPADLRPAACNAR